MSNAYRGTEEGGGECEQGPFTSASSFSHAGRLTELAFKTMHVKEAGSVFLALLLLLPVAVHGSSRRCATYKRRQTCGLKSRSVDFPCSYPKDVQDIRDIQTTGWSKKTDQNKKPKLLKHISALSSQLQYVERRNGDCTLKINNLKTSDASTYYFMYNVRNETGHRFTCKGDPGVNLRVFIAAAEIIVESHIRGQNLSAVTAGQRITLTCAPTCRSSLNSTLGYIWYKNQQQLNEQKQILSLDLVSNEDTGSYICAIMGYEDLRSSAINIRVLKKPTDTVSEPVSATTPVKDSLSTLGYDSQNSTDQRFNNCQTLTNKGLLTVAVPVVTSVCVGFAVGMSLTLLVLKLKCKDKKKSRECVSSVCKCPNPNSDFYDTLGVNSMLSEYETLKTAKRRSAPEAVYENVQLKDLIE